jgi:hypothetical protein
LPRDALDAVSVSFDMLELHDRNYMNRTDEEQKGEHEYFARVEADVDNKWKGIIKQWSTYQPHLVTK